MYRNYPTFLLPAQKKFFNQDFRLLFNFSRCGLVDGTMTHQFMGMEIKKEFMGVYEIEAAKIEIGFTVEWHYPDQCCEVLTAFSAELFQYSENKECLLIRWLQLTKNTMLPTEQDTAGISLLFSSEDTSFQPPVQLYAQPTGVFG